MAPRTLVDIFRNLENFQKPDLLLVKKDGAWRPVSTKEFMDRVRAVSSALEGLGVKSGDRVALLSENRPEWAIVDFACQCYGAILVPIFPTMVSEQTECVLLERRPGQESPRREGDLSGARAGHPLRRDRPEGHPFFRRGARRGAEGLRGESRRVR